MTRVTGLVPPIATPFSDGRLDLGSLHKMLDDLAGHVSGILVGGSVGEVSSLTVDERIELMGEVAAHVRDDLDLVVSISDNSILNTKRLAVEAVGLGAKLLVVAVPNYFTNNISMLEEYFGAIAADLQTDICIYDNPATNHTQLSVADIRQLAASIPRLTHVKVTDHDIDKVHLLREVTSLVIHAGDDAVLWHQLARGADGGMVALPMIYPELASAVWSAFERNDASAALEAYRQAAPFINIALGAADYVSVIKTVLHHRGVIASPEVRMPLLQVNERRRREVLAALEG